MAEIGEETPRGESTITTTMATRWYHATVTISARCRRISASLEKSVLYTGMSIVAYPFPARYVFLISGGSPRSDCHSRRYTLVALRSLAGFCNDKNDRAMPLSRPGGVRGSDRSDMGCSHTEGCPLFPLLRASLRGWRDYYCDSEDRWRDCARYKVSLTGRPVPISLLPNGSDAQHLKRPADADRSGVVQPRQAPTQAPPPRSSEITARFEPVPARSVEPPPHSPVPQAPGPSARPSEPLGPARGSRRRWWTRLADWMRASV
jgi:hypothetical protein